MEHQKTVFITGGTSGIGEETAIALAKKKWRVISTARSAESGDEAKKEIIAQSGNENISFFVCDLSSMRAIRNMCTEIIAQCPRIDVLINNAGVMEHERTLSQEGFELDFAVNYLAPFVLTTTLLPLLRKSAPSRIVNVASSLHFQGRIDLADVEGSRNFDHYQTYANSKLALMLFTKKLARDLSGTGVTVNALHPGVVATPMNTRNIAHMNPVIRFFYKKTFLSPKKGAETSVYLATAPEVEKISGEYFYKKKSIRPSALAEDSVLADALWDATEKLVARNEL